MFPSNQHPKSPTQSAPGYTPPTLLLDHGKPLAGIFSELLSSYADTQLCLPLTLASCCCWQITCYVQPQQQRSICWRDEVEVGGGGRGVHAWTKWMSGILVTSQDGSSLLLLEDSFRTGVSVSVISSRFVVPGSENNKMVSHPNRTPWTDMLKDKIN